MTTVESWDPIPDPSFDSITESPMLGIQSQLLVEKFYSNLCPKPSKLFINNGIYQELSGFWS